MAGFDIWDTFTLHTLHFLDTIKGVPQTMFTRLLSFYVHRSKRSTMWFSVTAAWCTDDCLFGNGMAKGKIEAF
jgi:hypothetical protein